MSALAEQPARRLVVWCPDWPVVAVMVAAGIELLAPTAVIESDRVLACSATARENGVRRGMRCREAQGRCPELVVHRHDPNRDARCFEPVVAAVESLAPGVEVVRPGLVAVPVQDPAGYFGSEEAAAERIVDQVEARAGVECQVGVAEGLFAAITAARRGALLEPGRVREFLAPLRIEEILQPAGTRTADRAGLVGSLRRLGVRTLGDFAALPTADLATRFGRDAVLAHRAACGREERPPDRRQLPPGLEVTERLDPPIERVDAAAFTAKALAEQLHARLGEWGIACMRLRISARTENGEQWERMWRCAEPLTPAGTADRVRWQLDGWLSGQRGESTPTAGVEVLSLSPEEVVAAGELQLDLLDSADGAVDGRAGPRSAVRMQVVLNTDPDADVGEIALLLVREGGRW